MEEEKKCFYECLLDLSFTKLITIKLVKALYIIGIAFSGATGLYLIVMAFKQSFGNGLLYVIAAPIVAALMVVVLRVAMELLLTLFKIEENTRPASLTSKQTETEAEDEPE